MVNKAEGVVWDKLWNEVNDFDSHIKQDPWSQIHLKTMDRLGNNIAGGTYLDAGCGPGQWCFYMSDYYGCKSVGYDIAEQTISRLNKHVINNSIKNVNFELVDLNQDIDIKDRFDLITSFGVIEHFEDSEPMLANLHKLLSDDGILFLSVPNIYAFHTILRPLAKFFGVWRIGYEKSFTPTSLKRLVGNVGFEVLDSRVLPSYDLFGSTLSGLFPVLKTISYKIESLDWGIGFVTSVILKKKIF